MKWSAGCTVFANFLENKSRSRQKNYTTFINSSGVIFERNMRVVNFWTMCHHSLGHEKKALLMLSPRFIPESVFYTQPHSVVRSPQSVFYTDRCCGPDFDLCLLYSPRGKWKSTSISCKKHCRLCGKNLKKNGRDYGKELFEAVLGEKVHVIRAN